MRAAVATAGMLSAAVLLAPGCGSGARSDETKPADPLRNAAFRARAAHHHLHSCPGSSSRRETLFQEARLEELRQLALRKQAGRSIWLGENDWAGVESYRDRLPCRAGEPAYDQALSDFSASLDVLAARIADHPQ